MFNGKKYHTGKRFITHALNFELTKAATLARNAVKWCTVFYLICAIYSKREQWLERVDLKRRRIISKIESLSLKENFYRQSEIQIKGDKWKKRIQRRSILRSRICKIMEIFKYPSVTIKRL